MRDAESEGVLPWCTIEARQFFTDISLLTSIIMKLSAIASALGARLENGSPDIEITGLNGIEQAGGAYLCIESQVRRGGTDHSGFGCDCGGKHACDSCGHVAGQGSLPGICTGAGTFSSASAICAWRSSDRGDRCQRENRVQRAHRALRCHQ